MKATEAESSGTFSGFLPYHHRTIIPIGRKPRRRVTVEVTASEGGDMGGAVTWFQLSAQDGEQLARFYRAFLDWNVREARPTATEAGVSGIFRVVETGGLSGNISSHDPGVGVVLFVEVDDLGAALERARELGIEKIWREDFDIQELGDADGSYQTAWMEDPAGNRLALFQSGAG